MRTLIILIIIIMQAPLYAQSAPAQPFLIDGFTSSEYLKQIEAEYDRNYTLMINNSDYMSRKEFKKLTEVDETYVEGNRQNKPYFPHHGYDEAEKQEVHKILLDIATTCHGNYLKAKYKLNENPDLVTVADVDNITRAMGYLKICYEEARHQLEYYF